MEAQRRRSTGLYIQRTKAVRGKRQCQAHALYRKQIMSEKLYRYSEGTAQRTDTSTAQTTEAVQGIEDRIVKGQHCKVEGLFRWQWTVHRRETVVHCTVYKGCTEVGNAQRRETL